MLDGSKARGYTLLFAGAVLWLINPERAGFGILDGGMLVTGIGLISGSDRSVAQLALAAALIALFIGRVSTALARASSVYSMPSPKNVSITRAGGVPLAGGE